MDVAILTFIALTLGGGVAGGLLAAWSCWRKVLAVAAELKTTQIAYEERFDIIAGVLKRRDKVDAGKARQFQKVSSDEALAADLLKPRQLPNGGNPANVWDPRTWGE